MPLSLKAPPTFKAPIDIHVPGAESVAVTFTFNHKTRDELDAFLHSDAAKTRTDLDTVTDIVSGWENVDAPFSRDNMAALLAQYHGAARAILLGYIDQLTVGRARI